MLIHLVLRIPTLAIHLDRQETFSFNKETQLFPIAGLVAAELKRQDELRHGVENAQSTEDQKDQQKEGQYNPLKVMTQRHHSHIVELIANDASVDPEKVEDFELVLYDTQKACFGG